MSFTWPLALTALLLLPVLVVAFVWHDRRRRAAAARFGNPDLLSNVIDREPGRLRYLPLAVLLAALAAMIVGVARPKATVSVPREEATVILAIDVSRSMKANDVEPTRLDAARAAARAFLEEAPERFQVGVVSFATQAVVGVPPTEDRQLVLDALDSLTPGEGTAIGDAVALSLEVGRPEPEGSPGSEEDEEEPPPRAILLLSDGKRDGGAVDPAEAAQEARARGVPVHTVLLGTPEGVVEERLVGGYTRIIRVPPSPETLQQVAAATGGQMFTAVDADQLRAVYEELGSRLGSRKELREITDAFAALAAVLLLVGASLSAFLLRRVP
jgi:Ca-activated chloride channel family protein